MAEHQKSTTWKAPPHTIAKINLLHEYLYRWFVILGPMRPRQTLLYVDGFCGPGEYTNHTIGSPIAALNAADRALNEAGSRWKANGIHCAFIDENARRIEHLKQTVSTRFPGSSQKFVSYYSNTFHHGIGEVRKQFPASFRGQAPLFVFIDPFGAKNAPFDVVKNILSNDTSEVLINLDGDGVVRIIQAGKWSGSDQILTSLYGTAAWQEEIDRDRPLHEQGQSILRFYKKCLRKHAKYVFSFEMRGADSTLNYFLVFASNHPLGLKKMKEAMQSIDQSGAYEFCDADVGQTKMFRFDSPEDWAEPMFDFCKGLRLEWSDIESFVLNETPFINPSMLLRYMQREDYIAEVEPVAGVKRRRDTFNENSVQAVRFHDQRFPRTLYE